MTTELIALDRLNEAAAEVKAACEDIVTLQTKLRTWWHEGTRIVHRRALEPKP